MVAGRWVGGARSSEPWPEHRRRQRGAVGTIEMALHMYRVGQHVAALGFYTEALAMAKTKAQKIALHSNRAACYLKLHEFEKAADECTAVLALDHKHTGALMLRSQTLVTIKEYQSALFDVSRLVELNPSSEVYQNLQARLRTQLSLAPIPESVEEEEEEEEEEEIFFNDMDKEQMAFKIQGNEIQEEKEEEKDNVIEGISSKGDDKEIEIDTVHRRVQVPGIKDEVPPVKSQVSEKLSDNNTEGWEAIPKPKGHSRLDYSRWGGVEDDSSEDDDEDEEDSQPQYQFRVKTAGFQRMK